VAFFSISDFMDFWALIGGLIDFSILCQQEGVIFSSFFFFFFLGFSVWIYNIQ